MKRNIDIKMCASRSKHQLHSTAGQKLSTPEVEQENRATSIMSLMAKDTIVSNLNCHINPILRVINSHASTLYTYTNIHMYICIIFGK